MVKHKIMVNRKTICFSKSEIVLKAVLQIYFRKSEIVINRWM